MKTSESEVKFELGQVVITPNASAQVSLEEQLMALKRHGSGDWGMMPEEDKEQNEMALNGGGRLFSAYDTMNGDRFWIITEWDRSMTTILMPEDY